MKNIYISLPITGCNMEDVHKRCAIAKAKYASHGRIITPVDIVKDSATPYATCIGKTMEALLGCKEAIFLSGWSDSRGCRLEYEACRIYNINIITDGKL